METIKVRNILTGEIIELTRTKEHPDSSYGKDVWVDKNNVSYGQCIFGIPFGYELIEDELYFNENNI